jgi:hypothetical protein
MSTLYGSKSLNTERQMKDETLYRQFHVLQTYASRKAALMLVNCAKSDIEEVYYIHGIPLS